MGSKRGTTAACDQGNRDTRKKPRLAADAGSATAAEGTPKDAANSSSNMSSTVDEDLDNGRLLSTTSVEAQSDAVDRNNVKAEDSVAKEGAQSIVVQVQDNSPSAVSTIRSVIPNPVEPVLFDAVYNARDTLKAKSEMAQYCVTDLKPRALILLEAKFTRYRIKDNGRWNSKAQLEMESISLLHSAEYGDFEDGEDTAEFCDLGDLSI
ncbi:hypothetical protein BV22DRAFT_1128635 [Leucogyrophana mollusca]|uniref:Uncharacterized protein n=1 Tax=Leucogyrophana mollusca TaxID=85980 RepID=A0ACB8BKT8_9AGAM|nr:hypothetical protein BV22DRAFT_1128635 [Leucogyrophana mollusca]